MIFWRSCGVSASPLASACAYSVDAHCSDSCRALVHVLREIGRQLVVIARDHGERRNQKNVRLIVGGVVFERLEIQHRREQRDAVERNAAIGEISGDAGRARRAVAFSEQ